MWPIAASKGEMWHRRSGVVFVYAMIAMGLTAVGVAVYEGKEDVAGGALTAYLVFAGWTTVRPRRGAGRLARFWPLLRSWCCCRALNRANLHAASPRRAV